MSDATELLHEYLDAGDQGDYRGMARLLSADVVIHAPGQGLLRGVDAQIASWRAAHEGLDELQHRVLAVVGGVAAAAARVRVAGIHSGRFLGVAPTGVRITVDQALFVAIGSQRITEMWEIVDTGSGLQQLGVVDAQPLAP